VSGNTSSSSSGIGVAGLLGVAFVVLKLTGVIDWDWIWVLAPFWIGLAIALLFLAIFGLIFVAAAIAENSASKRHRRFMESRSRQRIK